MAATHSCTVNTTVSMASDQGTTYPTMPGAATFAPAQRVYGTGTTNAQIDINYASDQVVAFGTPVNLDLSGALLSINGGAAVMVEAAVLAFHNQGSNDATIGGNFITSRFGASALFPLQAGGRLVMDFPNGGLAVTNSTADTITLTTLVGGSNTIRVAVAGRSA